VKTSNLLLPTAEFGISIKQPFASRRSFLVSAAGMVTLTRSGVAAFDKPEWTKHLEWSVNKRDKDTVEGVVSNEWLKFDIKDKCLTGDGEGRRTAMKYAATAAVHGYDWYGYLIAISTQLHNPEAYAVVKAAEQQIPGWLRAIAGDLKPLPDPRPAWPKLKA
jgi:hypothetical protein